MKYRNIREEELKNKVGTDWFKSFDTTEILGNIDFTVFPKQDSLFGKTPLLWAEAKTGDFNVTTMFVQLVLTIGKARTFDKTLPPAFLGAFDFKKIAFVTYISIQDIFYLNDFNWNVAPSNHDTKEFKLIKSRIEATQQQHTYIYDYQKDENDLRTFIANNIANATNTSRIKIDKNNFIPIYLRWLDVIKNIIDVNWDELKKANILDSDFYLADLFVDDNDTQRIDDDVTIRDSLFVVFQNQGYKIAKENIKQMFDATISIKAKDTYQQFWKRYKRPPIQEFQDYIIERRDLLVPQDIRERKGAFFTPRKWVELSQKYLADALGENWQEEYHIWDCAAGTGNLLAGLTNKYNIWASTLDQADVKVMHERIEHGANLLENHVFQFDFLNDEFFPSAGGVPEGRGGSKLPQGLQNIINDEDKRKKLVIYINPPYAEAATARTVTKTGENKANTSIGNKIYDKYKSVIGNASNELFTQFLTRIYAEISNCKIANFSTLKNLQSPNFSDFRQYFKAKLEKIFIVPANSFDNVNGKFPIGFFIWNLEKQEIFNEITTDVFNSTAEFIGQKTITNFEKFKYINSWYSNFYDNKGIGIGVMNTRGNDFQNQNYIRISSENNYNHTNLITQNNIIQSVIYLSVRQCIKSTWLNDRDQFLYPNEGWKGDKEFQNDCLAFALFSNSNNIQSKFGINHWIPFTEFEVNAKEKFESNFMTDFLKGKIKPNEPEDDLFVVHEPKEHYEQRIKFSDEAKAVFNAGRELWKYYHSQKGVNVNASLYDIREYFQGRNHTGKMKNKSADETYMTLIGNLKQKLKQIAGKIEAKVYEYGFLKV